MTMLQCFKFSGRNSFPADVVDGIDQDQIAQTLSS